MPTNFDRVMAYEKGSPLTKVTCHDSCVTIEKCYISILTWLMAAKLDKVMASSIGSRHMKLHDL